MSERLQSCDSSGIDSFDPASVDMAASEQLAVEAAETYREFRASVPDADAMLFASDAGLRGQALVDHWDTIGKGNGGFYDDIRENGCSSCGSHTPGCCDGCA